ncbi:MAG: hypothetical protein JO023_00120 [Chloroflexi bacterium]|nr:hypothetical protein [Chloroflexota bacterium]
MTDRLYICVSPHGGTHFLGKEPGSAYPSITHLQVAGHFVGFFLATSAPFYVGPIKSSRSSTNLDVVDTSSGRVYMSDLASCESSDCAFVPVMTKYLLASNGWVTELYEVADTHAQAAPANIRELVATYAPAATRITRQSVPLDFGSTISGSALSGQTADWTSDLSGVSSVVLGPALAPSSAPQAISACQLLTTTDVSPLLGPASSSPSPSQCQYMSQSKPSSLFLTFKTGLSPQQVESDGSGLQSNNSFSPIILPQGAYSMYVSTQAFSGLTYEQLKFFAPSNGSEVSLELTQPSGNADEQLAWLANVAFDRLFGIPVQRTN